jgi:hypothetical protein
MTNTAAATNTTFAPDGTCELSLRLRLRKVGMRIERSGDRYRLLYGNSVLLQRGPDGYGLTLDQVERFTRRSLGGIV